MLSLHKDWVNLRKSKNKTSEAARKRVQEFEETLEKLFPAYPSDIESQIEKDILWSEQDKIDDKLFWDDQKDPNRRKMIIGKEDEKYEERVTAKQAKETKEQERRDKDKNVEKGEKFKSNTEDDEPDTKGESEPEDTMLDINENEDSEYVEPSKRVNAPKVITLEVPRNVMKYSALSNMRFKGSARSHAMIVANTVAASGGNVSDFFISPRTAQRYRKDVVTTRADQVRTEFTAKVNQIGRKFVLHFDGKIVKEFTKGTRLNGERMAIFLSSPDLPQPQLLGVPRIEGGSGEEITQGIISVLNQWGISGDHILAMSFDTSASNTGAWNGACVKLEVVLKKQVLYLACRHHISELHIKHVATTVGRPTKGNEE